MDCTTEKLRIVYGDATLGVIAPKFRVIFSYRTGGIESLRYDGKEWVYRTPRPTFWRAMTDNDRGCRFHLRSGCWLGADMFLDCTGKRVSIDGKAIALPEPPENNKYTGDETAETVAITYTHTTQTVPATTVAVTYTVTADRIAVHAHFCGKAGLPELPVFGMRFVMPTMATGFDYEGLSGETYPDRKCGGVHGVYHVDGLPVTPYVVPQECGMHMDTDWVAVTRDSVQDNAVHTRTPSTLRFVRDGEKFAFSCLPYTAEEMENATHHEELPPARRTVLCINGAVRGVGGIDSWHTDVEPPYHVSAEQDHDVRFAIVF